MPTDPSAPATKTLVGWIEGLVAALEKEPATAVRIRQVVGHQRARIRLDDETVIVEFDTAGQLQVRPNDPDLQVDGEGSATRAEVCAILSAQSDASQAVTAGRVAVQGPTPAVTAMMHAIEILLDAAARLPGLRLLADEFATASAPVAAPSSVDGDDAALAEHETLAVLDLLP